MRALCGGGGVYPKFLTNRDVEDDVGACALSARVACTGSTKGNKDAGVQNEGMWARRRKHRKGKKP